MDVNEELSFCKNSKKKIFLGGVGGRGSVGGGVGGEGVGGGEGEGSGWM